jgi:predicted Zn-dependent protease
MTNKNLEQLLTLAIKAGATHAEVYQVRSHSRPVLFEGNRLKQLESSQGKIGSLSFIDSISATR